MNGRPATAAQRSLLRDHAFLRYFLGETISLGGTEVTLVVLPILVFRLTGSPLQTATLTAIQVCPYLIFGLVAGAVADRANRRRLMVGCDLLNVLLLGSIPVTAALGVLTVPQIYVVAAASATAFVWFDAANFGAMPFLVGRDRIVQANSVMQSGWSVVSIAAPALGGVLAAAIGPAKAIAVDAGSYAVSAICVATIPRRLNPERAPADRRIVERTLGDVRDGLHFLWHQRVVRALTLLGFGNSFTAGAVYGLLVVYAVHALGLASDAAGIGVLFAAAAVGALVASASLPSLVKRAPVTWISLAGMSVSAVLVVLLSINGSFGWALALLLLWQAANTLVIVNGISLRQTVTPEHLQGRVNGAARMVAWGGQPFGAATAGALATALGVRVALGVCAAAVATSAAIGFAGPLRQRAGPERVSDVDDPSSIPEPGTLLTPAAAADGFETEG